MGWLRRDHPNDVAQVENYSRITREVTPKLLAELRRLASNLDVPVRFVAQLGDFVEGMCGTPELAHRQCEEAVSMIHEAELGIPFFAAKGNHEIQGPGAADEAMRWLSRAVACGYRNRSKFRMEPAFTALRERPDFKALVARLEPSAAAGADPKK